MTYNSARLGALLLVIAGMLLCSPSAKASHCGAGSYSACSEDCGDPCSFSRVCMVFRPKYQLVWDTVIEKRWQTCYQTVTETVLKDVQRTCWQTEERVCTRPRTRTICKTVEECYLQPVRTTCYKECEYTVQRPITRTIQKPVTDVCNYPVTEVRYRDCEYTICRKIPETVLKEVRQVRHRPVCEVNTRVISGQVPKCVREQEIKEVCETRCVPVCETVIKECQYVVCRKVCEEVLKDVVCSETRTEVETRFKKVCRTEKVPVTCCKTVERKHLEWVTEQYCVPGKRIVTWKRDPANFCFDPCTMKGACDPGRLVKCETQCPDEIRCRRVPRIVTCCEVVPVTRYERHVIEEEVPYTVCRMEQRTKTRMVNCKFTEMVEETKTRQIPYTVCNMVPRSRTRVVKEKVCEMVSYTVKVPVPVTYTDQIECTVSKKVPICVEKDVCVRKLRLDPICQDPCLKGFIHRLQPVDSGINHQAPYSGQAPSRGQAPIYQSPKAQAPITPISFTQAP